MKTHPIKMKKFIGNNLDFWGFIASFACAVHCAAIPLLLLFGSMGSFAWVATHEVELGFILISLAMAYWSLWVSFKNHHGKNRAIRTALVGFSFLLVSRLVGHDVGDMLVVIGGLIIAYAHYINWRLLQP